MKKHYKKQASEKKYLKKLIDDAANKAMFNFIVVIIALMVLLFFHIPIVYYSIGVSNQALVLFFLGLVGFLIYTGYLLFARLTSLKVIVYLLWVIVLFMASITVKDIRVVEEINICVKYGGTWDYDSSSCLKLEK